MASSGGGGAGVCNKRCRGSDGDDDGETNGRNKRCGGVGPSSGRAIDDAESGDFYDEGRSQLTADDDDGAGGEDYMYGYYDDGDEDEADERSEGDAAAGSGCDSDAEQRYVVLTESDVRARQEADTAKVAEVLSIPAGFAAVLLRHFKWRVGRVQEEWFSDERRVRPAVGLPPPEDGDALVPWACSTRAEVCGICFDPFPAGRTRSVAGCGHYYCDGCWHGYVAAAVSDGARCLAMRCPDPSCAAPVVRELVDAVLAEAGDGDGRARYARFWLRSYVEESGGRIKWCGGAGCARAVEFLGDAAAAATDVFCDGGCRHGFCWACGEEAHRPVSCGTVRAWLAKNASDSETANWVTAHTKRCPKCRRPIEKNHGCNHMTCGAPCRHQFCWLCFDPWDNHRGCSTRYDYRHRQRQEVGQTAAGAAVDEEEETRRRHAKASLDRYLYHYERWAGNGKSLYKALADADELERSELERMARMVDVPAMELGFVTEAYRQIADGRRVLRWAHAYAYFLFLDPERDAAKRDLLDDLQSQANRWLECLHSCAELERKYLFGGGDGEPATVTVEAFRVYKERVANLTGVTRKFMGNLVKAFKTNLPEVVVTPPAFDFDHTVNGPTMGSQTAGVGGTISILNWYTQQANIANGSVQEHSPIRNPVQQPVHPGGLGNLSNPSQFQPMNSNFFGEATTSMGPPNIGAISPLQVSMSNMISSGLTSMPSVTFSMSAPGQPIGTQEMLQSTALGSFGLNSSNTSTAWDNSDIAESSSQPNSMGLNRQAGINPLSSAMNVLPIGMHHNAQQPPPKYVKIWEGTLSGQRQGQPVFICKLEGFSGTTSKIVAADWPETMQIVRLIAQEHMSNKQYVGKADCLIFRTLNQHGFLGQLQEKKLCAVIQLPTQTLLLSMSEKAGRIIGMLFPENMVIFESQIVTQPSPVQQEKVHQQPPPKYVKIWEGTLSGQRQGQPVFICKLEGFSGTTSNIVAADWPETMQIVRLIAQEHMSNKQYVGKADCLIFRTLNQHGFLGQLQEKKLCAVIQLPTQTLLLSMSEKAGRIIGMLFPENMVIFESQIVTQPSPVQQEKVHQQPPPKYVKIWEGTLSGQRQGQPVFICKLEGFSGTTSNIVAADWPETMQIVRLIAQEHMSNKQYVGKADCLIFRTLNQHGFLGQLQEKKLCAVIQLPTQTLLLSMSEKAGRIIGMLFPENMVIFESQIVTQPSPVQQEKVHQQPPPKYVKIWEGTLSGQRQGQPVFICKLEGFSGTTSNIVAADWPETMQIVRLIAQEHMSNKQYVGKADCLIFRTLNQHGFLGQLQEKKLCAVIQLPTQTLLLSMSEKAGRIIGMLFPENMVIFESQIVTQPSPVQQEKVHQQQELLHQQQLQLQYQQQQQNIRLQQHQLMQQMLQQQQMRPEQQHMLQQKLHQQQPRHQGQLCMFTPEEEQQPRYQQQLHQLVQQREQLRQQTQHLKNQQQHMQRPPQPLPPQMVGTELGSDDDDAREDWVTGVGRHD